jgi:hypothetical protein
MSTEDEPFRFHPITIAKMTTLLQEFEERLKEDREMHLEAHIRKGLEILEELKKKHNIKEKE